MADTFGKYDVYAVAGSAYCYPDTNVLRNRFGIKDARELKQVETDISVIRQNDLLINLIYGRFTPNHLKRIHRYLLGDVYSFAGSYRREDIAKGTTRFLRHEEIAQKLSELLKQLRDEQCLKGLEAQDFIKRGAWYFAELNYIHPFREGNGRTIREFVRQLFLQAGYLIAWEKVSPEQLLHAMTDSVYDTSSLIEVVRLCLEPQ